MAFTQITVSGRRVLADGTPAAGTIVLVPSQAMHNADTVVALPVAVNLAADGSFTVPVAANDDPDTSPTGTTYLVTEALQGLDEPVRYRVVIPHDAPSGMLDLDGVSAAVTGAVVTSYALAGHSHAGYLTAARTITAGTGLTGGGDLSADRTFAVAYGATAGTATQGNDSRLSDQRVPTDGSVTDAKVASGAAIAQSKISGLATSLAAKAPTASPTFTGTVQGPRFVTPPQTITYAATITPDAAAGSLFRCTATGDVTVADPTNGVDGQQIVVEILASGAARVVTVGSDTFTVPSGKWWTGRLSYNSGASTWLLS